VVLKFFELTRNEEDLKSWMAGLRNPCQPETPQAKQAAEKGPHTFCHSERSEESLFLFMGLDRREILRFAQNDKIDYFFRSL
jgi:hypothetical protein